MSDPTTGPESPVEPTEPDSALHTPLGASFTLTEAAAVTRTHRATIRRKLDEGKFPNAYRNPPDVGLWRIPLADIQHPGSGLTLSAVGSGPPDSARTAEDDSDEQAELRRERDALRIELQHEREMRQAHERTIDLLAQAMRAISPPAVREHPEPPSRDIASTRRRWWQR